MRIHVANKHVCARSNLVCLLKWKPVYRKKMLSLFLLPSKMEQISREGRFSNNVEKRSLSLHNDIKFIKRCLRIAEIIIYHCKQKMRAHRNSCGKNHFLLFNTFVTPVYIHWVRKSCVLIFAINSNLLFIENFHYKATFFININEISYWKHKKIMFIV